MPPEAAPLSEDDRLLLQELMNIAYGKAAADLGEVMQLSVELSVPSARVVPAAEIPALLRDSTPGARSLSLVEQGFLGELRGTAMLVLPGDAGKTLVALLEGDGQPLPGEDGLLLPGASLERETLLEVGNILVGACVGKLAELLGCVVSYTPPSVVVSGQPASVLHPGLFAAYSTALVLRTLFRFAQHHVEGHVFLVTSSQSFEALREALRRFLERYA